MTEADKANEGREETRIDFLTREVLNHLGDGWIKGVIVRQDINNLVIEARALRDQLSKEREKVKRMDEELTTEFERGYNIAKNEEREMRKELVEAFKELLKSDEFSHHFSTTAEEVEALIEKATELDKK